MKEVWLAQRGNFSARKLAQKICDGEFGVGTDLDFETVRALFGKWANTEAQ